MDSSSQQKAGASANSSGKFAEAKKTRTRLKQEKKPETKPPPSSSVPCKYFKQGNCWYGELCRFKHAGASSSSPTSSLSASAARSATTSSAANRLFIDVSFDVLWNEIPVCRFWSRGLCKSGHKCNFKHPDSVQQKKLFKRRYQRINYVLDDVIRESLGHGPYGSGLGFGYGRDEHCSLTEHHLAFADDNVVLCHSDCLGLDEFDYHALDDDNGEDDDDDDDDNYYDDDDDEGSEDDYDDRMAQRMRNCGFTDDEVYELSLQGIKPWDPEAWDALDVINGYY